MSCKECKAHKTCIDAFQPHSYKCNAYDRKASDYIKREDALAQVNGAFMTETYKKIEAVPSADVVERKRGHWLVQPTETFTRRVCSECDYDEVIIDGIARNFCPSCGADMGERKDNE